MKDVLATKISLGSTDENGNVGANAKVQPDRPRAANVALGEQRIVWTQEACADQIQRRRLDLANLHADEADYARG